MSKSRFTTFESNFFWLVKYLILSDLEWLGRILIKSLRLVWHDRSIQPADRAKQVKPLPTGPYRDSRKTHAGDLLLWVPRRIDSFLIDDLTGGYGYSHATIDSGEVDTPTGKPVMIEITIGQKVTYKFQDEYGPRPLARLPLSSVGVDVEQFMACVKSKLGELYDVWDALTLGEIKNPAKEVCSGVAADCLPKSEQQKIAEVKRLGLLSRDAVSVHSKPGEPAIKIFISPNGFAEYYGAPKGRKLPGPDVTITPQPIDPSLAGIGAAARRNHVGWSIAISLFACAVLVHLRKRARSSTQRFL